MVLGICQGLLAAQLREAARLPEAISAFERSRQVLQSLVKTHPTTTEFRLRLAEFTVEYGDLLLEAEQPVKAIAILQQVIDVLEAIEASNRDAWNYQRLLGASFSSLGDASLNSSRDDALAS
jgi:hypothetical protein